MSAVIKSKSLKVDDYLKQELISEIKHELIDGHAYAMTEGSVSHNRLAMNLYRQLGNHLENSPCDVFSSDMKLRIDSNFFYPDVMVDCRFDETEPYFATTPIIIVEVLSKSTRKTDKTIKLLSYTTLQTLQEYVVIEQDFVDVEVFRRNNNWRSNHYFPGDNVAFESIDLSIPVVDIYRRVQNEDVIEFLRSQSELNPDGIKGHG